MRLLPLRLLLALALAVGLGSCGDPDPEHFAAVGDRWDVEERSLAELHRVGLPDDVLDGIARLRSGLDGQLGEDLAALLTISELRAFRVRLDRLSASKVFPRAPAHRTPIPWPPL